MNISIQGKIYILTPINTKFLVFSIIFLTFANEINKQLEIMKLKHFAGYGSVEVTKKSKTKVTDVYGNTKTKLVLQVKGNHEWGNVRDDIYDVRRWIFNRFEKNFNDNDWDIKMSIQDDYVRENGIDVEVATYTFIY